MAPMEDFYQKLEHVDSVKIFFTDLNGRPRNLQVNVSTVGSLIERGIGFDGSSIAGIATVDDSDRFLVPIPESLRIVELPGERVGFLVGRIDNEKGVRSASDPRAVLERALSAAETQYGLRFLAGPEYEFFLLKGDTFEEALHTDSAGYFHANPHDKGEGVRKNIADILDRCGMSYEKAHHEVTPSQHEINFECAHPLEAADRTVLLVHVTQKVAAMQGWRATFMPKPFDGQNRNAFHIHLSALDLEGRNVFYDAGGEHHLSPTARHFIGGILKYARETSIVMASTFNSYKAYVAEREAPVVRGWGVRNRSSMVRVPHAHSPESTRLELRNPDATGNVYLQLAVLVGMGLQGIKEKLDCGEPDAGSTYKRDLGLQVWDERFLPKCMFEALVEAERSRFLREILGERIFDNYMALKIADWEEHRTRVTTLEYQKYLSI